MAFITASEEHLIQATWTCNRKTVCISTPMTTPPGPLDMQGLDPEDKIHGVTAAAHDVFKSIHLHLRHPKRQGSAGYHSQTPHCRQGQEGNSSTVRSKQTSSSSSVSPTIPPQPCHQAPLTPPTPCNRPAPPANGSRLSRRS